MYVCMYHVCITITIIMAATVTYTINATLVAKYLKIMAQSSKYIFHM